MHRLCSSLHQAPAVRKIDALNYYRPTPDDLFFGKIRLVYTTGRGSMPARSAISGTLCSHSMAII